MGQIPKACPIPSEMVRWGGVGVQMALWRPQNIDGNDLKDQKDRKDPKNTCRKGYVIRMGDMDRMDPMDGVMVPLGYANSGTSTQARFCQDS